MKRVGVLLSGIALLGLVVSSNAVQMPRGYKCDFSPGTYSLWSMTGTSGQTLLSFNNNELFAENITEDYCCVRAQVRFPNYFDIMSSPYIKFKAKRVIPRTNQKIHFEGPYIDTAGPKSFAFEKTISLTTDYQEFYFDLTADLAAAQLASGKQISGLFEFIMWLDSADSTEPGIIGDSGYYIDDFRLGDSAAPSVGVSKGTAGDQSTARGLSVSCNPSSGMINVTLQRGKACRFEIVDIEGKRARTVTADGMSGKVSISRGDLAKGIYILKVAGYQPTVMLFK